jgi:hypothetical protein
MSQTPQDDRAFTPEMAILLRIADLGDPSNQAWLAEIVTATKLAYLHLAVVLGDLETLSNNLTRDIEPEVIAVHDAVRALLLRLRAVRPAEDEVAGLHEWYAQLGAYLHDETLAITHTARLEDEPDGYKGWLRPLREGQEDPPGA